MATETHERYRLAVLGSGKVGKTSLIRRYLNNTYTERYKETVEDIYSRDFYIRGHLLPLDMYDTNFYYPDMRKLTISSANAFMLVFATNDVNSFKDASEIFNEIVERRSIKNIPIVIVGTKCDLPGKKIYPQTVTVWIDRIKDNESLRYVETSAKENVNVVEVFQTLLELSGFPSAACAARSLLTPNPIRRNLSVRAKSPSRWLFEQGASQSVETSTEADNAPNQPPRPSRAQNLQDKCARLTRHGSLMKRTQRLSLRIKHVDVDKPDESDCRIS